MFAQANFGGLEDGNPTEVQYAYWFSGDMLFTMALPLGAPGTPGRTSAFMPCWGFGGGWKSLEPTGGPNSSSFLHVSIGVSEYFAGLDPRGNRQGILLGQGVIINIGEGDGNKFVQGDLYIMYAVHDPKGFFFGIGGHLGLSSVQGYSTAVPTFTIRWGGLDFWR